MSKKQILYKLPAKVICNKVMRGRFDKLKNGLLFLNLMDYLPANCCNTFTIVRFANPILKLLCS